MSWEITQRDWSMLTNQLDRINRNLEKFLDRVEGRAKVMENLRVELPDRIEIGSPQVMTCAACLEEINYRGGEPGFPVRQEDGGTLFYCPRCGVPE